MDGPWARVVGGEVSDVRDDVYWATVRRVRTALRWLTTRNGWLENTVGDVARRTKLSPAEIVRLAEHMWLVGIDKIEGEPIESWVMFEDGE